MALTISNITITAPKEDPANATAMIKNRVIATYVVASTEGAHSFRKDCRLVLPDIVGTETMDEWWQACVTAIYANEGLDDPFA